MDDTIKMFSINKNRLVLLVCASLGAGIPVAQGQTISSVEIKTNNPNSPIGELRINVNGQQKIVTNKAFKAWVVDRGRASLWSAPDGAGGFENEGQSLWSYDVKTGRKRKLIAEYFMIENVREVKSHSGKTAYVLSMTDGGLGGPHLALVDPNRGLVWRQHMARLTAIRNGRLAIGMVTENAISAAASTSSLAKVNRMIYLDIDGLLKRPTIVLKRTM